MKKIANFIVNKRLFILVSMVILTIVSTIFIPQVKINDDMTKYLPDDSSMKIGLELMEQEFPEIETTQTIRVMFNNLTDTQKQEMKTELVEIPYVDSVAYETDSEEYNRDTYTLFVVGTSYEYNSPEELSIEKAIQEDFAEYDVELVTDNPNPGMSALPNWAVPLALMIVILVLLFMCGSWVEPLLFLAAIGMAVVLNSGTNIFLGSVSNITAAIGAILQLVLSMDYSIILMNRYRQERETTPDKIVAMKKALGNAFSSITSSSMTTVLGLLVMVFMSLKIGMDMGIVLAKGVLLSMLCIFTVLPGLILLCDKLIQRTAKKSLRFPMEKVGAFSYKSRRVVAVVFLVLFAGSFILQGRMKIATFLEVDDPIADVFTAANPILLIYDNDDEKKMAEISALLEEEPNVDSVLNYASTLGKPYRADEMADNIKSMTDVGSELGETADMGLDSFLLNILYYDYYTDGKIQPIVVGEFLRFVSEDVMENAAFSEYLGDGIRENMSLMTQFADPYILVQPMSAKELANMLGTNESPLDENAIELMYLYYASTKNSNPNWTLSIEELFRHLSDDVVNDPRFSTVLDDEFREEIQALKQNMDEGIKQLKGPNHSRMILTTTLPVESEETKAFFEKLTAILDEKLVGDCYLVGNSAMGYEVSDSFTGEMLFITLLSAIAIFFVVALTFRSLIIPAILVSIVQCGIFIIFSILGFQGTATYYLALLVVQCILMGATIDYGILFTNYYRENRSRLNVKEALIAAYNGSIHTIATSGLIMVLMTAVVGFLYPDPTLKQICLTLSQGCLCAVVLILIVLPGMLAVFDRFILKRCVCMKITNDMIHSELRATGRFIRTVLPFFKASSFDSIGKLMSFAFKGRADKKMCCEQIYIPRKNPDQDNLRLCVYSPLKLKESAVGILWLHGGGYGLGLPEQDGAFIRSFVLQFGCVVIAPDYQLSTKAPYPAALEDCYNALLWMKQNAETYGIRLNQLMVGGDSAGGGLTAALTIYARDKKEVSIAYQMPLYPMLDDRIITKSSQDNDAPVWNTKSNEIAWKLYLGSLYKSERVPAYASPSRLTNYKNLPPAFTFVGSIDPFCDETIAYMEQLKFAGVPVNYRIFEGCFHGFDMIVSNSTPAKEAKKLLLENLSYAIDNYFTEQPKSSKLGECSPEQASLL